MGTRGSTSKAPADPDLLALFCDLVGEYDRLGAAFPVSVSSFELGPDQALPELERWNRIVRATALRKFVLGKGDHVRADKVVLALERSLRFDEDRAVLTRWQADFRAIGRRVRVDEGADGRWSLAEILEDLIYGTYLHGDLERRARTTARWGGTVDLALWMFSEDAEFYIRRLRTAVLLAGKEGKLKPAADRAVRGVLRP